MAGANDPLSECIGFEWDEGNSDKNCERHEVTTEEAEDIFFNEPLVVASDVHYSKNEKRYYALGQTAVRRLLFVAFTIRKSLVRVISVRDMNRKERAIYAKYEKNPICLNFGLKLRNGTSGPNRIPRSLSIGRQPRSVSSQT